MDDMPENEKSKKGFDEYDCRRFADTLMDAEEIKKDPAKMKAAKKHITKMKKKISSIADLKELSYQKDSDEDDGDE